jgi:hypothetical protein
LSPATADFLCFCVLNFCHLQQLLFDVCFVLIRGSLIFFLVGNFGHLQRLQRLLFEGFFMGSSLVFFFGRDFLSPATAATAATAAVWCVLQMHLYLWHFGHKHVCGAAYQKQKY